VRGGRGAQLAGERKLTVVLEVMLAAEEDHLVLEQRRVDGRNGLVLDVCCQAYAVNAGADVGPEFHHVD